MTNIIVAFSKPEDGRNIKNILMKNGLPVLAVCTFGAQVLAQADDLQSGIVISGFKFGDMNCRQMKRQLPDGFDVLLVASPSRFCGENMENIVCLPAPFKVCDLVSTVRLLEQMQTERRRQKKRQPVQRNEEEKRVIDQAKKILMDKNHMTEPEAHKYLQKCSMDSGNSVVESARMVLSLYR